MGPPGQGLLLASLSVPSEGAGLGRHLAKRLVELLGDGSQPMELRSACGDLLRASLVSQRLMETEDLPASQVRYRSVFTALGLGASVRPARRSRKRSRGWSLWLSACWMPLGLGFLTGS